MSDPSTDRAGFRVRFIPYRLSADHTCEEDNDTMKLIKIASAATLLLAAAGANAQSAAYGTGIIEFTGEVTDLTCTISGGAGAIGTTNITVPMDAVEASALAAPGQVAGLHPFQLVIGGPGQGTCQNGKVAELSFQPTAGQVDASNGNLRNQEATAPAANTQIQVLYKNAVVDLRDPSFKTDPVTIANNTATIDMASQYIANGGPAAPGFVQSYVNYRVVYN